MPAPEDTPTKGLTDVHVHYSNVVRETWSEYIRFLNLGMAAAGFTVIAIAQYLGGLNGPLGDSGIYVKTGVVFAGLAGIAFALCRWLCQLIMERQVYGPRHLAEAYFADSETRAPNALRYSVRQLAVFYAVNDISKFVGAISLVLSWGSILFVLFLQVDMRLDPVAG